MWNWAQGVVWVQSRWKREKGGWIGGERGRPLLGASLPGRDGRREKIVNKYAAIVYIRLNASMNKQKKIKKNCIGTSVI